MAGTYKKTDFECECLHLKRIHSLRGGGELLGQVVCLCCSGHFKQLHLLYVSVNVCIVYLYVCVYVQDVLQMYVCMYVRLCNVVWTFDSDVNASST